MISRSDDDGIIESTRPVKHIEETLEEIVQCLHRIEISVFFVRFLFMKVGILEVRIMHVKTI